MREYIVQEQQLVDIATAIRQKTGLTASLEVVEMPAAIQAITSSNTGITPSGTFQVTANGLYDITNNAYVDVNVPNTGLDTSDADATASTILAPYTAYVDGNKVTGNIPTKTSSNVTASGKTVTIPAGYYAKQVTRSVSTATQATPEISVRGDGLITASSTQSAGYVTAGTKTSTKQLPIVGTNGYTPTTTQQVISAGQWLVGDQYIAGDENLVAGNIKKGVSIFNVTGTYGGEAPQTCTVTINAVGKIVQVSSYLQYTGDYNYCYDFDGGTRSDVITLNDVVVNSPIVLCFQLSDTSHSTSGSVVQKTYSPVDYRLYSFVYISTSTAGGTITLS
jgi:hypothetical protein